MRKGGHTPGTTPWFHSLIHTGNPLDAEFYASLARPSSRVLELGSGLGRISFEMAEVGARVTGLELDPQMVSVARESARAKGIENVSFETGDMRDFDLGGKFDLVVAPYNALLCLLTEEDLRACLERVAAHLKVGGTFAFDIYDPGAPIEEEEELQDLEELSTLVALSDGGREIKVFERDLPSEDPRRMDTGYLFEATDRSGTSVYEHRLPQRLVYLHEVKDLLASANLELTQTIPDFHPGEIDEETLQVAFVSVRR